MATRHSSGPLHLRACLALVVTAALSAGAVAPGPLSGQILREGAEPLPVEVDSADALSRAKREQARFESRRARLLPASWGSRSGSDCDEIVGRFCFWFDDGSGVPPPEPPAVDSLRQELLAYLDSVQGVLPGERWVTGQRVWYRVEGRRWSEALRVAGECDGPSRWCQALRGLALHMLGRYTEAEAAFQLALDDMEPSEAARWNDLGDLLDGGTRRALERAEAAVPGATERLWALADPLLLVPGNERRTEHYARWTVAALQAGARNPFGIRWGRDMEELTVRTGWEVGWERTRDTGLQTSVVGHHPPDGRDFFPRGDAVVSPELADAEDFDLSPRRPRNVYTPGAAPLVRPLEGQVAVFPRGDEMVVVATHYLPADTAPDPARDSLRARLMPPAWAGAPSRAGLFLIPVSGGAPLASVTRGGGEGALLLHAPAGPYVVGVESWVPEAGRAGRFRAGLALDTVPPDVLTLSDLLLVRAGGGERALEELARDALVRPVAAVEDPIAVAWEVNGLGWTPTEVRYDLSVARSGAGLLRRFGQALGLVDPDRPLSLSWTEPGPTAPAPVTRVLRLELEGVEPGAYVVTLRVRVQGRGTLAASVPLTLTGPNIDDEGRVF